MELTWILITRCINSAIFFWQSIQVTQKLLHDYREHAGITLEPASLIYKQHKRCGWVCYQFKQEDSESKYTNKVEA